VDSRSRLQRLTLGALAAARHIVIPVSATVWSTTGLRKFVRWIDTHREDEVISARLLGLVATIVPPRTRVGKGLLQDLGSSPFPAFDTSIPRRIGAEDAVLDGAVVGEPGADPVLSDAYRELAVEVVKRVEEIAAEGRHRAS
jgi:cellulose biosynthesis protein BcsQ